MSQETILSLLLSIPIGIIGGLYAGIIVARYQRFADLRLQAKKIVLEIDFIWEETKTVFPRRKETPELQAIATDLFFLQHKSAGNSVLELSQSIHTSITDVELGRMNSKTFADRYQSWQHQMRSLAPSTWQILRIWGGL